MILLVSLLTSMNAKETSYWDKATSGANSLWDKTKEVGGEAWDITKDYSNQGKNIFIEQTLKNGINALVDTTKIEVKLFDINDTTNKITMQIFLSGEDEDLNITIEKFDWGVSKDKKYIVFEKFDIDINNLWIDYIVRDMIKRDNGYLKIPNKVGTFSLLYSIKPNTKTSYKQPKDQKPFDVLAWDINEAFIKVNNFKVKDKEIKADIWLLGSKKSLQFNASNYVVRSANDFTVLVLQNLKITYCTKPWIKSLVDKDKGEIHLNYTDDLYDLLNQ